MEEDRSEQLERLKRECEQLEQLKAQYEEEKAELERQRDQARQDHFRDEEPGSDNVQLEHEKNKLRTDKQEYVRKRLEELMGPEQASAKDYMVFNAVAVKYYPGVDDANQDAFAREDPKEGNFRINRTTTFKSLRETACKFWVIPEEDCMALRAANYGMLDLYDNECIYQTVLDQHLQPEFYLYGKNPQATEVMTEIPECFLNEELANSCKAQKRVARRANYPKREREHDFVELEKLYPGLKSYKPPEERLSEDRVEKERLNGRYGSFLSCLMVLLLLFCTISILIVRREVSDDYWIQSGVHSTFLEEFGNGLTFFDITNYEGLSLFILEIVGPAFLSSTALEQDTLVDRFFIVGPVQFRVARTKERECETAGDLPIDESCYYLEYDEDSRDTADLDTTGVTTSDVCSGFDEFHSADSNKIDSTFQGEFSDYDGSGYVWNVNTSNVSLSEFQDCYNNTLIDVWLDRPTRALFINSNLYAPNYDVFISLVIAFEVTASGYVYPSKLAATVIRINVYDTDSATDLFATVCEGLRFVAALYFLYLCFIFSRENRYYLLSVRGPLDLALFTLTVAATSMSLYLMVKHSEVFDNSDRYYDLQQVGSRYISHLVLNVWLLLFALFRLISIFNISRRVHTFLLTLEYASADIFFLLVIMVPLLVGLLLVGFNLWGSTLDYYRSIGWALLSSILFTLGYGNIEELLEVNEVMTIIFFFIYFFVLVFFIFSAFLGILIDAYRRVRLRNDKIHEELREHELGLVKRKMQDIRTWIRNSCKRSR